MSTALDTLWYTRCPVPTGLGIAVQKGWLEESFRAKSTKIESLRESNNQSVRESHFDHTLANSVRHGGNIPAIWARAIGRETKVIGLSWADEAQLILTTPNSGIRNVKDLKGRKFGLPKWVNVQIDFVRAQALRGLENALSLDGLAVSDVEIVDYEIGIGYSDAPAKKSADGSYIFGSQSGSRNDELIGLLRGEVDAIFLKGASAVALASQLNLVTVIDTGAHPEPLIRANNGTPRTLSVDTHLIENHFDAAERIVEQVLRAEDWAHAHPDETRRFLAKETNSSEYWVSVAYGTDAHLRLQTDFAQTSIDGLQDFVNFLHRWEFIPQPFNVNDWIDTRPYDAVISKRQAITA
ncbi:ABC transporter substrate-binding protein [Methylotenera oryzisoli]|uniref:ABC transporter substrate-binding protein n=1 Tax=Methylotenera oryzisoli TaxID=2080758 RepID=A0A4Y9VTC0_9PROT|nr:ABC transporter substrate-binding protein [Methylotenera oryzisoli]TFW72270.1 ABC transporter substrate-binding protein [Methylotenera oryzisoli]